MVVYRKEEGTPGRRVQDVPARMDMMMVMMMMVGVVLAVKLLLLLVLESARVFQPFIPSGFFEGHRHVEVFVCCDGVRARFSVLSQLSSPPPAQSACCQKHTPALRCSLFGQTGLTRSAAVAGLVA